MLQRDEQKALFNMFSCSKTQQVEGFSHVRMTSDFFSCHWQGLCVCARENFAAVHSCKVYNSLPALNIQMFWPDIFWLSSRFPFYYELKIIFVIWLLSPATKGSSVLYRKFVHPELLKREQVRQLLHNVIAIYLPTCKYCEYAGQVNNLIAAYCILSVQ